MAVQRTSEKRPYRLRERARKQEETRRRITEATVELHATVGAARTTISAIAERAGVERLTVYRHFPDERALFEACSAHWIGSHPLPDPGAWAPTADPRVRLRDALAELYAYYETNDSMLANNLRDAPELPVLAEVMSGMGEYAAAVVGVLAAGWGARGRRRTRLLAAIGHAIDFETWRSLVKRQGLPAGEAVELAARLVAAAAAD
jgi:AcrR family transcriptional regulator